MRQQRLPHTMSRRHQDGLMKPAIIVGLCGTIFATGIYLAVAGPPSLEQAADSQLLRDTATLKTFEVDTSGITSGQTIGVGGQLRVNNTLVLNPTSQPEQTTAGQIYYDESAKEVRYYNGSSFQGLVSSGQLEAVVDSIPTQQPSVQSPVQAVTNVTQQYLTRQTINNYGTADDAALKTDDNTFIGTNIFTGTNTFADVSVEDFAVSGAAALQGSLTVTGATALGSTSASSLLLSSALNVSSGGTGRSSFNTNEIVIGQGTGALSTISNGVPGLCLISTAGAPSFQTCPGGTGSAGVSSLAGLTGDLLIANSSTAGSTITIDSATSTNRGLASFNATNLTVTSGSVNTIQDIAVTAAPTFAGLSVNGAINGQTISSTANFTGTLSVGGVLTANTIAPNSSMIIGANGQSLTLQGSASTSLSASSGANKTTLDFATPSANVTYRLQAAAAGTYNVCTTAGNCTGINGGVTTTGGTAGTLARFDGSQTLVDSILSESGSTITVNGSLAVNTITPTSSLTVGSTAQSLILQGDSSTRLSAQLGGITNSLLFSSPSGSNKSIVLPNASGTVVVSASGPLAIDANGNVTCASCTTSGGGSGGAVDSLNGINGAVVLNDASVAGSTITINDASTSTKGIASFNSTNFSVTSGAVNTIQDISVSSSPTFNALSLTTPLAVTSGGTGASTASGARTNLGAASSGANTDITSLGGLSTALSVSQGGTGTTSSQSAINTLSQLSTEGDLLYFNGTNSTRLARGGSGECLTSSTTSIAWGSCGPGEADTLATVTSRGATTNTGVFLQGGATSRGLTIDTATSTDDTISINVTGGGASSFSGQITAADLTANRTWTLPDASGTFCLQGSSSCGFLTGSASNYIQNQNASQQATSNFWISGTGRADIGLQAPSFDTATSMALNIGGTNASVLNLNQDTVLAAAKSFTVTGGATGTRPASPTEGMVYFDTTTKQLITYANNKWQASRSSSTKIVAASNSSQSAKDAADYVATGAGDQAQVNTALTAAAGGTVYLMEGTYYMSAQVSIPNNTTLSGAGAGTVLTIPNAQNATYAILRNSDTSTGTNVTVRDLQIDGNRVNQTGGSMTGISLASMGAGTGSTARIGSKLTNLIVKNMRQDRGVTISGSNNIISGSTFQYNEIQAINLTGSNNVITGNTFHGNQNYTINVGGSYNTVSNNLVESGGSDGIRMGGTYGTVSGNTITGSGSSGIVASGIHATVTGNTTSANNGPGILASADYATVTGNTISGNASHGVQFQSNNSVVSGNSIDNNTQTGIMIYDDSNQISSNRVHNNGSDGIQCFATCNYNSITGNHITDTAGSSYAIQLRSFAGTPTGNYLSGNTFSGIGASSINDEGVGTIYSNQRDGNGSTINRSQGGALTIGTTTASASLTLQGGMVSAQLAAPTLSATVTNVGTAGATTYRYQVTALDGTGETVGSTIQQTTTGNATLSGSNYNTITWTAVPGAYQYNIYKCAGAACTPLKKTTVAGSVTSFNDQSAGSPVGAAPGSNTTGGATFAGGIQGSTASLSGTLTVAGATTLNGTLTGTGTTLFKNTGNSATAFQIQDSSSVALFTADTSATKIVIRTLDVAYDLTVAGHIITGGSTPSIAADVAACTTPTVSVSGTDTAGSITVTTGTGCAVGGALATVTFSTAFGATPKVSLTPAGAGAAALNAYLDDASLTSASFQVGIVGTPTDATTYKWHYHALQ